MVAVTSLFEGQAEREMRFELWMYSACVFSSGAVVRIARRSIDDSPDYTRE